MPINPFFLPTDPQQRLKILIKHFVSSLVMRDWEDDPDYRKSLVWEIVKIGEPAVIRLVELLEHPDWAVRRNAVSMLGRIGSAEIMTLLLEVVLQDESTSVRLDAVSALERMLERINPEETVPELMKPVAELARSKEASSKEIFKSWLWHQRTNAVCERGAMQERDRVFMRETLGIISLSPDEQSHLKDRYQEYVSASMATHPHGG